MRIGRFEAILLLGGPLLFLLLFLIVPFLMLVVASLHMKNGGWTLIQFSKILADSYYWGILWITLRIALWVTAMCFIFGYALAYYLVFYLRSRFLRRLIYIVIVTPLFTSNIVRAFGWIVLLGRQGLVNELMQGTGIISGPLDMVYSETSIVIGLAYVLLPFLVLTVSSVLQNMNPSLLEAARDLGASPFVAFLKVTLPLSLPGVIAGSLIVFTLSVSAYVTPSIMSGGRENVMSMLIYQQYMVNFDFNFGAALALLLMFTTFVLMGGCLLALERRSRLAA
jgi:putative spermidine/putrescine transport system permease protein